MIIKSINDDVVNTTEDKNYCKKYVFYLELLCNKAESDKLQVNNNDVNKENDNENVVKTTKSSKSSKTNSKSSNKSKTTTFNWSEWRTQAINCFYKFLSPDNISKVSRMWSMGMVQESFLNGNNKNINN